MSNDLLKKALTRMQSYCSRSEKCEYDVRQKMFQTKIDINLHDKIIDSLKNDDFINELRFANAYVLDKFKFNMWGRIRIRLELQKKGIAEEIIENAILNISKEEYENLIKKLIANKKIKAETNYEYSQKMLRYLYGKGYEPDIVSRFISDSN